MVSFEVVANRGKEFVKFESWLSKLWAGTLLRFPPLSNRRRNLARADSRGKGHSV